MKYLFLFIALSAIAGCFKDVENISGPQIEYRGKAIDDKTGQPLANLKINVVGHNNSGGILFGTSERVDLGYAYTDSRGNFFLRFKKWEAAQTFEFSFSIIPGYYGRFFTLEAKDVHSGDTTIQFTNESILKVYFKNTSPVDGNDGLSFSTYSDDAVFGYPLTSCTTTVLSGVSAPEFYFIVGNGEGSKSCPVGADRKYYINYRVRKSGVVTSYRDSVFCTRGAINTYNLNY
jgi:hypothetical protein